MITIRIAESREDKKIADQIVILHHSYLADNWKAIGETAGLPADRKSVSMKWDSSEEIKVKYAKPTGENKKKILITERL